MVLQGGPCGRVGHRRTSFEKWPPNAGWPFHVNAHELREDRDMTDDDRKKDRPTTRSTGGGSAGSQPRGDKKQYPPRDGERKSYPPRDGERKSYPPRDGARPPYQQDLKSTRLNSSHGLLPRMQSPAGKKKKP